MSFQCRSDASDAASFDSLVQQTMESIRPSEPETYTGTLIESLFSAAVRVLNSGKIENKDFEPKIAESAAADQSSEPKQFSQALSLSAAHGNLGLLFVIHSKLVGTLEPRDNFPDSIDVHEIRPVRTPE